jgi:hypothetical protein|eukprot:COSAG01_NODE_6468_length_3650_cov_2.143622_2_plen_343_part_00
MAALIAAQVVNQSLSPGTRWLSNKEDALAAYTHALLWFITQDERHALKAIQIMDAWAALLKEPIIAADGLEAAWSGTGWCRAAEIIKHTTRKGLWPGESISQFSAMLTNVYLPWVNEGASTNGNIALVMSETFLHIGVFTDNRSIVDAAVELWRQQLPSIVYISADGPTPKRPPLQRDLPKTGPVCGPSCDDQQIINFWHGNTAFLGHDGVAQETCRDLGHTNMMYSALANFAETSFHQGIDLYAENSHRIISGAEFQASMMADEPHPFFQKRPKWLCGGKCPGEFCKNAINGSTFDILYNHYVHRMNLSLPNVTALLPKIRPTSCFDQLCFETLTHGSPIP